MSSIGRYIVRTTLGAFTLILVSLTAVIWITHALRDIDVVTTQGQTVFTFIGMTALLIPALVLVIAPLALMIATTYALNKLNTDSEIIVMNAAGMSPWRIFVPFLLVGLIVAALVGAISTYIAPKCLRELRTLITRVRADVVTNIIQPGRFTNLQGALTFHIRERKTNGDLGGIFIDDGRDPNEHATFLAERGRIVENESGTFLILEHGSAQRLEVGHHDPTIVLFERYAFDLTQFNGAGAMPTFNVTERYLWDLAWPDPSDPYYKQNMPRFRSELNDRLVAPVYPLVFTLIVFAVLGAPRTSRQSRGISMVMAIVIATTVRMLGFASIVFSTKQPGALWLLYLSMGAAVAASLLIISRAAIIEPPAFLLNGIAALQQRFARPAVAPA